MIQRRIGLLVLWIASLVLISLYGGALSYGLYWTITLIPVVSILYLVIVILGFSIDQQLKSRTVIVGQQVDYLLELKNDSPFSYSGMKFIMFPDFFTMEKAPENMIYELTPGGKVKFETGLKCRYRGSYDIGVQYVVLYDFLNIFSWKYRLLSPIKAIVKPQLISLSSLKSLETIAVINSKERLNGQSFPDALVRNYIMGDSIRRIHWKATARTGELKVRQYNDESNQGVSLYFEGRRYSEKPSDYLPLENKLLETVLAVSGYFARQSMPVYVTQGDGEYLDAFLAQDEKGFEALYEMVSDASFYSSYSETESQLAYLDDCLGRANPVTFMVVHELDDQVVSKTNELTSQGIYVIIYLISDIEKDSYKELNGDYRQVIVLATEEDLIKAL